MKPTLIIRCITLISTLSLGSLWGESKTCSRAHESLESNERSLAELTQLKSDLETRFESYCKEDFSAQVEGIANEYHRNKAIKVAFAKRRLAKLIDGKSQEIISATAQYCQKCTAKTQEIYCQKCPDKCK